MGINTRQNNPELLPFEIILAASNGNVTALNRVVSHYAGYINTLAARTFLDEYGNAYPYVDKAVRRHLETKLITQVLNFTVA